MLNLSMSEPQNRSETVPTGLPVPSGEPHGEQIVALSPPVLQGIQLPTALNLSAKTKTEYWKIYKQ